MFDIGVEAARRGLDAMYCVFEARGYRGAEDCGIEPLRMATALWSFFRAEWWSRVCFAWTRCFSVDDASQVLASPEPVKSIRILFRSEEGGEGVGGERRGGGLGADEGAVSQGVACVGILVERRQKGREATLPRWVVRFWTRRRRFRAWDWCGHVGSCLQQKAAGRWLWWNG